jgi:hypothetical protein
VPDRHGARSTCPDFRGGHIVPGEFPFVGQVAMISLALRPELFR